MQHESDQFAVLTRTSPGPEPASSAGRPLSQHLYIPHSTRRPTLDTVGRLSFLVGSVRSQKALFFSTFTLSCVVGAGVYLSQDPAWRTSAEVRIGALASAANEAGAGSGSIAVSASDIAQLLESSALQTEVRRDSRLVSLAQTPPDSTPFMVRTKARQLGHDLRAWSRRMLGSSEPSGSTTALADALPAHRFDLRVNDVSDSVVGLTVTAGSPAVAEAVPGLMVEAVRANLAEAERSRARTRLTELASSLQAAATTLADATTALKSGREQSGLQDPAGYAIQLQQQLGVLTSQRLSVETESREISQQRLAIISQLMLMEKETVGSEIVADNPRIQDLQGEISELQSQYNALTEFTDKYPKKLALKNQIDAKKRELEQERQTVVSQLITTPNPLYEDKRKEQLGLDQKLSGLAGRLEGLTIQTDQLTDELDKATRAADMLAALAREEAAAREVFDRLEGERRRLATVVSAGGLFANVSLIEQPHVRSSARADSPSMWAYTLATLTCGFTLALVMCVLRAVRLRRIVCQHQVDLLARRAPIQVVAILPRTGTRGLLSSAGANH